MRKFAILLAALCMSAAIVSAQSLPNKPEPLLYHSGDNEFGAWAGFSPDSPTVIGVTTDRKLFLAGVNWSRVILAGRTVAWKYVLDVIPVAVITQPAEGSAPPFVPAPVTKPARSIYGIGLNPLGMQFNFLNTKKVQPFADIHGGFLYFREQVPVLGSQQFNFTASWGGGIQWAAWEKRSITFGYRFHHLSNNEGALRNPGSDANLFYVGLSWRR